MEYRRNVMISLPLQINRIMCLIENFDHIYIQKEPHGGFLRGFSRNKKFLPPNYGLRYSPAVADGYLQIFSWNVVWHAWLQGIEEKPWKWSFTWTRVISTVSNKTYLSIQGQLTWPPYQKYLLVRNQAMLVRIVDQNHSCTQNVSC